MKTPTRDQVKQSRRGFLRTTGLLGLGAIAAPRAPGTPSRPAARRGREGRALNVIWMVADGMSSGTLTLADRYCTRVLNRPLCWRTLWTAPGWRRCVQATHSADSLVTDSAAAASAWGAGTKFNNGAICVCPDGRPALPLLLHARECGKATGLVTTTRITHATPAGFGANVPSRDQEGAIALQLLDRGFDVLLGGGLKHFPGRLLEAQTAARLVRTKAELLARGAGGSRLLGLFASDHMSFSLDRPEGEPTLREMAGAALDELPARPGGFVLQIEGGRVDHAGHNNDAAAIVREQIEFDDCLAMVAGWSAERDDTLVIVTTDHATGNPGLTRYGPETLTGLEALSGARRSFEWIEKSLSRVPRDERTGARVSEFLQEASGVSLSARDAGVLDRAARREKPVGFEDANDLFPVLGSVLANHYRVAFATPHHTADHVELLAFGPGSELIPAFVDNTELWKVAVEAMDLKPAAEIRNGP